MNDDRNEKNDVSTELNSRLNNIEQNEVVKEPETISHIDNSEVGSSKDVPSADVPDEKTFSEQQGGLENVNSNQQPYFEDKLQEPSVVQTEQNNNVNPNPASENNNYNRVQETQRVWQMQNFQGNVNSQNNNYYRENYRKTQKKSEAWKYILVSIVSSIIGGAILTVMLLGVAPVIQPELRSFFGGSSTNSQNTQLQPGELKRVEIVQTAESAVTSVAEKVGPSVVGIRTTYQNANDLFGVQSEGGEGSGIIISSDGYILTNHHVIENAINDRTRKVQAGAKIQVYLPNKIDKPYVAEVKGYDSKTDLAVLKINENNLNTIEFGNSDDLKVGEPAIAIGNPGGLEYMGSVTQGVISGLNRTVQLDGGRKIRLVQTDAAINPGNSGGALVNIKGQLIGVNTVKMVATGFEGLGFAIPVNDAKKIADELIKNTYISKPYLGISVDQRYTEDIAKENNMPMGVYVASVEILGAAEKAGIQAGDVITKFDDKKVKSFADLEDQKNKHKPGDTVSIEIYREGKTKTVKVKLGETK